QIVSQAEQVVSGAPDQPDPERHHLHVAACARAGYRVLAEIALDLDQGEDELRIELRADRLEMHRAQELHPRIEIGHLRLETARHLGQPVDRGARILEAVLRGRPVRDRCLQARANLDGQRLVDLRAGEGGTRHGEPQREQERLAAHGRARSGASGSSTGIFRASLSRPPWYSITLSLSPRSPTPMRWGIPMSSMSANITPGRSSRSSNRTSCPAPVSAL